MKSKFFKTKQFYTTIGSVSLISGIAYFGNLFVSKDNILTKIAIKSINSKQNKDYIYLNEDLGQYSLTHYSDDGITSSPVQSDSSRTHFQLLRLAQTRRDSMVREFAISAIASTRFKEYECQEFAQTCDFETSVRLARIAGIDPKLFLPPIGTNFIKANNTCVPFEFEKVMQNLLKRADISGHQCSECTQYFTQLSIKMLETERHSNQRIHSYHSNDFMDIDLNRHSILRVPEVDWLYLQSITKNILCGKDETIALVENGLFLVLHYLRNNYSDQRVEDWIAQTLANLSAYRETHLHFWSTRWLRVLVEWLQSDRLECSLSAAKVLSNLSSDFDTNGYLLPESMYLIHPIFYNTLSQDFDVVLVHGLLGGTFKTWRQCDSEKQVESYTRCWPQSWLATAIPNIRVLAVNYQTFLSNWNIECQDKSSIFTLRQRSSQLLNDLMMSRIGQKPIVWITHSMGGLLVKQILVDISESKDPKMESILNQTKGIIFYSVPHKGTDMAVWSPGMQRIMSPSSELLELRKDSKFLLSLHKQFVKLIENKSIECLSFGETLKSSVINRPFKWNYLLVPEDSSNPGVGEFYLLSDNHFNTCKPKSKSSEAYERTIKFIENIIESNKSKVDERGDKTAILLSMFL